MNVKNMCITQSNHKRVCNCYCYCLLIIPWIYDQGRFASSEHRRAYMEDIHEQVWICTEGDGYIIWGKGIDGEKNVFAGGDVYNL